MKCEKCGKDIKTLLVNHFNYDGSDCYTEHYITECEENAVFIDTDSNWTGYGLTEEEQKDTIKCPYCQQYPVVSEEIQVEEIVRIIFFKKE